MARFWLMTEIKTMPMSVTSFEMITKADEKFYEAKGHGRTRIP